MIPYFILTIFPILSQYFKINRSVLFSQKKSDRVINSFFLIFLLLLILRDQTIGCDLISYYYYFNEYGTMSFSEILALDSALEIGYSFFSKTIYVVFGNNFQWLIAISAIVSVVPIWVLYKDSCIDFPYFSIVLFLNIGLFSMYFSGLRQVIAIAFVVFAYDSAKEKKIIPFIILIIIAICFHKSAFIGLAIYPVFHLRLYKRQYLLLLLPLIGLVYYYRVPIFSFLLKYIDDVFSYSIHETGALTVFLMLLVFLILSYVLPSSADMDYEDIGLRNLLFFSVVLQVFASINFVAMRMNYYYLIFVPVTMPRIISKMKNEKWKKIIVFISSGFLLMYFFIQAYYGADALEIFPYKFFWRK